MWDDDADVSPTITRNEQFSNHSAKSFNGGFSVGKGRGFGNFRDMNNALPQVGSNNYSNQNANNDDLWDDAPKQSSGHQNDGSSWQPESDNKSGWGRDSSDRRNNNTTSSWSNKREGTNAWENKSDDAWGASSDDRRGGFKSSRACHTCSQKGHISKDCPNKRRDGKSGARKDKGSGCFNCGQEGHMSRECPSGDKRSKGCFKCGEEGHTSRDCPNNNNAGNERRGRGCFNCGEDGHMSRDCPTKNSEDNRRAKSCFKCGDEGHMSRDCTNPSSDNNRKGKGCFKCGDEGHMSRDCTNPSSDGGRKGKGCFNCGEEGHMSRDCTNPSSDGGRKGKGCFNCGEEGHMSKDCPNPDKRLGPDGKPRPAPYIPPDPSENEDELFEGVPTGINFSKYDAIPVDVTGKLVPPAIQHFSQANFLPTITKNILRSGYDKPTPVQKFAIPVILKKRDLMACAQTGSGKTAAFLLPIIQEICSDPNLASNSGHDVQTPLAVVVAPTRELAIQIFHEAQKFSHGSIVRSEVVYGGTSVGHQSSRIKRGCHILVATPGRLLDFVEKGKVSFEKLRYLVLDEADRMLDMGFIPAIRKMVDDPNMPQKGQKQTLMFSATFPAEIQNLAKDFLDDYIYLTVGMVGAANTDVEQTLFKLDRYDKRQKLMDILSEAGTDRTLVFVEQKRTADFIASFTSQNGIPTTSIHGDRLQKEREEALRDFRTGRMPVLVATAVAARGLDIRDVRHVINYDLPQTIDEYVHRIGRTGRVGNLGKATSFYDSGVDQPLARSLKKILVDAQQEIPDWLSEEANNAVGTEPQYSGRGNFGSRDVRSQGRSNRAGGRSDAWNNDFSSSQNDNFVTNSDMSQPLCPDDSWD